MSYTADKKCRIYSFGHQNIITTNSPHAETLATQRF